ncbi:MAG: transcription factor S [Promethearchaeota archaeon]
MVDFCPNCSSLLRKKTENGINYLFCRCGYQREAKKNVDDTERIVQKKKKALEKKLVILSDKDKISIHIKVNEICPKCGHTQAEAWQRQMRSADEPSTSFFKCLKCNHTWRKN